MCCVGWRRKKGLGASSFIPEPLLSSSLNKHLVCAPDSSRRPHTPPAVPRGSGLARPAQEVWLNHTLAWEMPRLEAHGRPANGTGRCPGHMPLLYSVAQNTALPCTTPHWLAPPGSTMEPLQSKISSLNTVFSGVPSLRGEGSGRCVPGNSSSSAPPSVPGPAVPRWRAGDLAASQSKPPLPSPGGGKGTFKRKVDSPSMEVTSPREPASRHCELPRSQRSRLHPAASRGTDFEEDSGSEFKEP